jgi:hypothetical protein
MHQEFRLSETSLEDLLAIAERSFVRMEAQELIGRYLEEGDQSPFEKLLENLVLAGTSSLALLRDILDEIRATKSSLSLEGVDLRQELIEAMGELGIQPPQQISDVNSEAFIHVRHLILDKSLHEVTGELDTEDAQLLEDICGEAGKRAAGINRKLILLNDIEQSVVDWFHCLTYEAARSVDFDMDKGRQQTIH